MNYMAEIDPRFRTDPEQALYRLVGQGSARS